MTRTIAVKFLFPLTSGILYSIRYKQAKGKSITTSQGPRKKKKKKKEQIGVGLMYLIQIGMGLNAPLKINT